MDVMRNLDPKIEENDYPIKTEQKQPSHTKALNRFSSPEGNSYEGK